MKFDAVLFDLDGTLLDTVEDLADSMNAVLHRAGLPVHPVEAYKIFVGDGMEMLARRVLPEIHRDDATVALTVAAMRDTYALHWADKTHPYPGIPELLDGLAARGVAMAILSNKPDDFTRVMVDALLPRWRFVVVQGARPDVPRKPDPAAALAIADALERPPAEILYLGDTGTDMRTAVAAGMFPVGVLWGFRTADELLTNGAAALVGTPEEVLDLL